MTSEGFIDPVTNQEIAIPQERTSILPESIQSNLYENTQNIPEQNLTSFIPQENPSFIPSLEKQMIPKNGHIIMLTSNNEQMSAFPISTIEQMSIISTSNNG